MGQTIITRVGFCPSCFKEQRAKTKSDYGGNTFIVYGTNGWHERTANHNSRYWGYVPHIYRLHKSLGENVVIYRSCAVQGCGTDYFQDNTGWWLKVIKYDRQVWTIQQWNALVLNPYYHDFDYFI